MAMLKPVSKQSVDYSFGMKDIHFGKAFDGDKSYNAAARPLGAIDQTVASKLGIMFYYVSKVFWLIAAPTNALILISAIAAFWAVLRSPNLVACLAAAVACGLVIGTFTPIGLALKVPLEHRFAFSPPDSRPPPDGIILLAGVGLSGIVAVAALSQDYPKARLIFSGFSATDPDAEWLKIFARLGGDPTRISVEPRSRTTSEDALYAAALLKPKPRERWILVTSAMHMPRAVGCFRVARFQVEPYPVEFSNDQSHPLTGYAPGSGALFDLDAAAKEWIGLVAYRLMGKTDTLFPGP
jgi:uncharacterized SAM-binding protein YcdF (DUF218 family)